MEDRDKPSEKETVANFHKSKGRDWFEDFSHENGNYHNTCCVCKERFTGHKRRVICRLYAKVPEKSIPISKVKDLIEDLTAENHSHEFELENNPNCHKVILKFSITTNNEFINKLKEIIK